MVKLNFKHLVNETPDDVPIGMGNSIPRDQVVLDSNKVWKFLYTCYFLAIMVSI
jgi:hypothetical protein